MLLIGETGVGKSMWINSFANYCKFISLEEAVQAGGLFPIPCTFGMIDPETTEMITISSEGGDIPTTSQTAEVGASVTQMPDVHAFVYENNQINLIDTPGMNATEDTSDHAKDKEHVNNILRILSTYNEIQAICILIKASETRLSSALKYTLTELLGHLDKDACNNVIFIFTNAASTNFKPDKTRAILQKFLNDNKLHISLPPSKLKIYCFENGTMDYLAQRINHIHTTPDDKDDAMRNWDRSAESTKAILDYVRSLKPHALTAINTIHNAEHTIGVLSELVLQTLMCIAKDENNLEQKKKEAETVKTRISENPAKFASHDIKKLLHVEETKVVNTKLDCTNVVCEGPRCGKVVNGETVYPQICCEHCKSPWMYFCGKINWLAECKVCGCEKRKHKWRKTVPKIVTETVYKPDEKVIAQIVDSSSALTAINETISECERRVKICIRESEDMLRTCAKLNNFVHQNTLIAHDDELSMSLQDKIEIHVKAKSNAKELEVLRQIQDKYKTFMFKENYNCYRADDVGKLIQQLYKLPMKGNDLKKAMEVEEMTRRIVVERGTISKIINLARWRAQPRKLVSSYTVDIK